MNFLSMEYFAAVARHRNITRAAAELHITQQTLSAHISSIEKELGATLFVRKSPLELTYAGEVFLRYAQGFNDDLSTLKAEFADITENQRGRIRVGVAYTRGRLTMPYVIQRFHREYPGIDIELFEKTNEELIALLREGAIDVFVGRAAEDLREFEVQPFYSEEIVMLVPRGFEVDGALGGEDALQQLAGALFVLCKPNDIAGRIGRTLIKQAGIRAREAVVTDNAGTMLSLCARGIGPCFCPSVQVKALLTAKEMEQVQVFRFEKEALYQISFAFAKAPYRWGALKRFIAIARENAANFEG